ncbi:EAL domain-containing response regulator [Halomonas sp. McH1-25]|uniref:EAL domain-containing response regulator n=1 Tax=unclassified Halomonas TaxID=2609666 RepID=UPI001EF43A7C|nr:MULTISPECIES: EAL domain-containing response regulator [unclassified Halomonas]MCG7599377.1 EAL domain-containing response regulator [Halomonas sp. McH1-25]MCP1344531.1 EAL domain-containing response regulator [Halomonas sp. FL8]MCP1362648.1 EAL domain-containing response regulator [Halomonas sp. BBD45]MCP1366948.1 EAL domain-containing response regulator [Halomonas sp. BBD48]
MPQRALIVDDDVEIQLLGQHLLRRRGFEVITVGGLDELARQPDLLDVDLILLDFGLGEFTGLDILQYLRDLRLNAAVVLLSGCNDETAKTVLDTGKSQGMHMLGFIPKGQLLKRLDGVIQSLADRHRPPSIGALDNALRQGHFFLAYQPKIDLQTGQVLGVEALLRWQDPQRGLITPDSFLPLAERSHRIVELSWHVLDLALAQQARWKANGWALDVAINIPAQLLKEPNVLTTFDRIVVRHTPHLEGLTLELTESAGIECLGYARHILSALRERGCRLALDDFGTGYSSMIQLYRLPFDELKLDRSFVSRCDEDREARAITLTIVDLGRRLDMKVVAEGIETPEQQALLRHAHCDIGQGYLFARPMPAMQFDAWYLRQAAGAGGVIRPEARLSME